MPERSVLVTGGSSGIGLAIAHVLVEEGYEVTVADLLEGRVPIPAEEMIQAADIGEAVRFVLRASRHAVVPEIRFIRPADQLLS